MGDFEENEEPRLRPFEVAVCVGVVELEEKADIIAIIEWCAKEMKKSSEDGRLVSAVWKTLDRLTKLGVLECHLVQGEDLYGVTALGLRAVERAEPRVKERLAQVKKGRKLQ